MNRFSEKLSVCRLDDELVLLDGRTGSYFGLNAVGARLFELLQAGFDREAVATRLLSEYDVAETQLRGDIDTFLFKLSELGFIECDDA